VPHQQRTIGTLLPALRKKVKAGETVVITFLEIGV